MLRDAEQTLEVVRDADAGRTGRLRLGFVGSAAFGWLPRMMKLIRHELPEVTVFPGELTSEQQPQSLVAGQIDLGLVRYPIDDDSILCELIEEESLMVAMPESGNSMAGVQLMESALLDNLPLILFPRSYGPPLHDLIVRVIRDAGGTPRVVQEAVQMTTVVGLVAAGFGVGIVPESISAMRPKGVRFYRLVRKSGAPVTTGIYLAQRRDERSSLVLRVQEVVQGQSSV